MQTAFSPVILKIVGNINLSSHLIRPFQRPGILELFEESQQGFSLMDYGKQC